MVSVPPARAPASKKLCQSGATRIVRAGSAGGMQSGIGAGDLVIAPAAVREEGLSHKLVPPTYPAIATPDVLMAMRAASTLPWNRVS